MKKKSNVVKAFGAKQAARKPKKAPAAPSDALSIEEAKKLLGKRGILTVDELFYVGQFVAESNEPHRRVMEIQNLLQSALGRAVGQVQDEAASRS